jgi:hypothetical protein
MWLHRVCTSALRVAYAALMAAGVLLVMLACLILSYNNDNKDEE